eukprot:COSAG02_NODE_21032_length_805_cov_1.620397_1_plen_127_part_10
MCAQMLTTARLPLAWLPLTRLALPAAARRYSWYRATASRMVTVAHALGLQLASHTMLTLVSSASVTPLGALQIDVGSGHGHGMVALQLTAYGEQSAEVCTSGGSILVLRLDGASAALPFSGRLGLRA